MRRPTTMVWRGSTGLPVELPLSVLQRILRQTAVRAVMIRDGVIVDAGSELDLGRSRRLASAEQRIVLRARHATCAMPGCPVAYEYTKLHHVTWWERGGPTDLDNLVPLCERHHHAVHDLGWKLHLQPDRTVTVALPDGTSMSTGPPGRVA